MVSVQTVLLVKKFPEKQGREEDGGVVWINNCYGAFLMILHERQKSIPTGTPIYNWLYHINLGVFQNTKMNVKGVLFCFTIPALLHVNDIIFYSVKTSP